MTFPQPSSNKHAREGAFHSPDEARMGTEVEVSRFLADTVRAMKPRLVVETGTHHAYTALPIAQALTENAALGFPGELWTFEVDAEAYELAQAALAPFPCVRAHLCRLQDVTLPGEVDVAFVDSAYETRQADVSTLSRVMNPGGLLFVHDTAKRLMRPAVKAWRKKYDLIQFPTARGLALLQRRPK